MRKVVLMLLVAILAAPAIAAVTITAVDEVPGTGVVSINYVCTDADADGAKARLAGIALNITADNGCTIDGIVAGSFTEGESTEAAPGYGIFMGSIDIQPIDPCDLSQGYAINDAGTPEADPCDPGTLTGPGEMTIELGALFDDSTDPCDPYKNAPLASGTLCKLQLSDPTAAGSCTVTIALEEDSRGGAVMEDTNPPSSVDVGTGFPVSFAALGCDCKGDADGNGKVQFVDLGVIAGLINNYGTGARTKSVETDNPMYDDCGDADDNDKIQFVDLGKIAGWINLYGTGARTKSIDCPHSYN